MNNEMTQHGGSELVLGANQTFWTDNQRAALAQIGVQKASDADLAVFFHQSQRTGLDPFAKQIYMIERKGKQTIQTGIDGFRLIARRTIDRTKEGFGYRPTLWCGRDGQWRDVWLEQEPPAAAKVGGVRGGQEFDAIALFDSYAGKKYDGNLNAMWSTQGAHMIAKCAEALALRKAFPQDLSGLYTSDEMAQADNSQTVTAQVQRSQPQQQTQPEQDFYALLDQCQSRDDLNAVAGKISAAGRMNEFRGTLNEFWKTLAPAEPEPEEVVDGTLVDDDGVIQDNAA
ncbi:MAG: recombinase RecT [Brevibacterium aurantiacum]|nr:recombinase RecT [Brevibacterium aurantiacum]